MAKTCFSIIDIAVTAISLCSFVFDVGTDVTVCIQYFCNGLAMWGWLTLALTVVPAVVMNIFSLAWHIHDKTVSTYTVVSHVLLLAPVHRYVGVLHLGVKAKKSQKVVHSQKAWRAQNDVSILRLFEAFMESAPQLVLQLFIIVHHKSIYWFTGLSTCASFLSLSWALTAYSDSLRRACKSGYQRRIAGLLLHWAWQLFMALSRISAFVVLTYVVEAWVFVGIGIHWLLSFVWICTQGTDFGNGSCEKWMFRAVCAFIYIFVFLNLNDGVSRYRLSAFYTILLLENTAMVVVYFLVGDGNYPFLAGTAVFGGFLLGLVCMCLYYSFLHPTKPTFKPQILRLRRAKHNKLKISTAGFDPTSTVRGQLPIFSIESPQSVPVMDGTSVNLSMHNIAHSLTNSLQHSQSQRSSAFTVPVQVHETLKQKWQTGMDSSCTSSSSSLASDSDIKKTERPSSRASENSNESERSNNCLLSAESKNNLNKCLSPKLKHKSLQFVDKISNDDPSFNTDNNLYGPESPSLSRCSWARSSDDTRQSLGVEEFVTIGFDCSSSIERRIGENGSFNSRPKSLSPLNVSNLWQDARSKLRQTIAATIAAATCNPSSNENTPNNSQSFVSQATSSQDESISSSSHQYGFMDSKSSFNDRDKDRLSSIGSNSLNSGRHREALSSLSDISESAEPDQLSDMSCEVSVKKSPHQQNSNSESNWFNLDNSVNNSGSPYPEDSTLTASKLGHKAVTPVSYLTAQNRIQSSQNSTSSFQSRGSANSTPVQSESSAKMRYNPDGSPFTDQELTSVMAKSLQSYSGASSSTDSTNKEREGLALTLEDLEYPVDLEVDGLEDEITTSYNLKDSLTKSRSTSSLFHDVDDSSSPASSASKMQRVSDLQRPESDISPNAFKQLDLSPSYLMLQSKSPVIDKKLIKELQSSLNSPKQSEALKILIEAYGQLSTTTRSPQIKQAPDCARLSVHRNTPGTRSARQTDEISKNFTGKLPSVKRINPEFKLFRQNERDYPEMGKTPQRKSIELFDSIAWQKSKLMAKQKGPEDIQAYGGHSSTKKLNVHNNKQIFELHDSPRLRSSRKSSPEDNGVVGYVEGKYCPPLCKSSVEIEEEYIQNDVNLNQRHSYKSHSPKKEILSDSMSNVLHSPRHSLPSLSHKPSALQRVNPRLGDDTRQQQDFYHLRPDNSLSKTARPLQHSFDSCLEHSWDVNEAHLVADSPLSYSQHQRSIRNSSRSRPETYSHPAEMRSRAEQELRMSAMQVENYFHRALKNVPVENMNLSTSDLNAQSMRQPLKSLQNSPQHNPGVSHQPTRQTHQFRHDDWGDERRNAGDANPRLPTRSSRRLSLDGQIYKGNSNH